MTSDVSISPTRLPSPQFAPFNPELIMDYINGNMEVGELSEPRIKNGLPGGEPDKVDYNENPSSKYSHFAIYAIENTEQAAIDSMWNQYRECDPKPGKRILWRLKPQIEKHYDFRQEEPLFRIDLRFIIENS